MRTTTTRKKKRKERLILPGMLILSILAVSIFIGSEAFASAIQNKIAQYGDDDKAASVIFAAACATCHGADGMGGVTWIKNSPSDKRTAPRLVGRNAKAIQKFVRRGSTSGAMPGFGVKEIAPDELIALSKWLQKGGDDEIKSNGVEAPTPPSGTINEVILNILDATPWFQDEGTDAYPADVRRVELLANEYLKVVNTGRTWHTFTNPGAGIAKDSGFIGYAGNYKNFVGDLGDMGYYYADQGPTGVTSGLATGCIKYFCKLHPYMAAEVCTSGNTPKDATTLDLTPGTGESVIGMTRAHKHKSSDPAIAGVGEVWVSAQSQEDSTENTTTVDANKNVGGWNDILGGNGASDKDGAYQVIDASNWSNVGGYIPNVGNNPHNSWPGKDKNGKGKDVVLSADWHDNTVVLMDANTKAVLGKKRAGGANAHVQVTPGKAEQFYVTIMGGVGIQRINVDKLQVGLAPSANVGGPIRGDFSPHGLWFCDDGRHILTANTLSNSATLYDIKTRKSASVGSAGTAPLAPSIMSGYAGGCERGFTNNAISADVSIYNLGLGSPDTIGRLVGADWGGATDPYGPAGTDIDTDDNGTIDLRDKLTLIDQGSSFEPTIGNPFQARWANLPIQTPVSPADATTHGRFIVTANKASFNVSITGLDSGTGLPWGLFTIPAGLGAHGVTYGLKSDCDWDDTGSETDDNPDPADTKCYYAYVSNTFEDYVSVYDLEKIDVDDDMVVTDNPSGAMGGAGSALIAEQVYVEGGAVAAVAALDPVVAGLCDVADLCDCGNDNVCSWSPDWTAVDGDASEGDGTYETLVYDLPGGVDPGTVNPGCVGALGVESDAAVGDYNPVITDGFNNVLYCGIGAMNTAPLTIGTEPLADGSTIPSNVALYVANLPIGVVCPDCRSGVHAGDIQLDIAVSSDAPLAGPSTGVLTITFGPDPNGAASDYAYYKTEVYVDTETTACAVDALSGLGGFLNDCDGETILRYLVAPETDIAGRLNGAFETDLQLGINTGGQGIVTRIPTKGHGGKPWP